MLNVRQYNESDYEAVKALYLRGDLYGGQFDEARDSKDRLNSVTKLNPNAILVCEFNRAVVGTVSLIDDGRIAWLFRFAVEQGPNEKAVAEQLYEAACSILRSRGHSQVLVYSPVNQSRLEDRYLSLGMKKGGDYTCFWQGSVDIR